MGGEFRIILDFDFCKFTTRKNPSVHPSNYLVRGSVGNKKDFLFCVYFFFVSSFQVGSLCHWDASFGVKMSAASAISLSASFFFSCSFYGKDQGQINFSFVRCVFSIIILFYIRIAIKQSDISF